MTPYVVLDGDYLPSKAKTESERERTRAENMERGQEMLAKGNRKLATEYFQKAIDITPEMAAIFVSALKVEGIPYVVAPYEADAQLAYLEKIGLITAIVTEDSDLLVFGCKTVLLKMDQFGECIEISRDRFSQNREISLIGWTDQMFRFMAILSGCDYLESIPGLGLKTAHRLVKKYRTEDRIMKGVRLEFGCRVMRSYEADFCRANLTFLHQRVYCPNVQKVLSWNEYNGESGQHIEHWFGAELPTDIAIGIASGTLNPITKIPIKGTTDGARPIALADEKKRNVQQRQRTLIETLFTPSFKPLREISPNLATTLPSFVKRKGLDITKPSAGKRLKLTTGRQAGQNITRLAMRSVSAPPDAYRESNSENGNPAKSNLVDITKTTTNVNSPSVLVDAASEQTLRSLDRQCRLKLPGLSEMAPITNSAKALEDVVCGWKSSFSYISNQGSVATSSGSIGRLGVRILRRSSSSASLPNLHRNRVVSLKAELDRVQSPEKHGTQA